MNLRPLAPLLALGLAVTLTACGGDDEPSSKSSDSSAGNKAGTSADPDTSGNSVDDLTDGEVEGLEGVDDALDAVGDEGVLNITAEQLVKTISGASGYDIDGSDVTITVDGSKDDASSNCVLGTTVLDAFDLEPAPTLTFVYDDGTESC